MNWQFESSSGKLFEPTGGLMATGYAGGNCGKNPEGVNNPALQDQKCIGPLPHGPKADGTPNRYTFAPVLETSKLGPWAIPLIPDSDNEMFGRGSFFIHGDTEEMNHSASEGCIILPRGVRLAMAHSSTQVIEVI